MRVPLRSILLLAAIAAAVIYENAFAEIPNKTPAQLEKSASHVITGKVVRIYSTVERTSPKWEFRYSVAELQVEEAEKGDHEGPLAYVRFWHKRFLGDGPPEPSHYGHRGVPKIGAIARVYVTTGEDGGYDIVSPNGFAAVESQRQ